MLDQMAMSSSTCDKLLPDPKLNPRVKQSGPGQIRARLRLSSVNANSPRGLVRLVLIGRRPPVTKQARRLDAVAPVAAIHPPLTTIADNYRVQDTADDTFHRPQNAPTNEARNQTNHICVGTAPDSSTTFWALELPSCHYPGGEAKSNCHDKFCRVKDEFGELIWE